MPEKLNLPKIPKYEVLEEVGHGGMATVYRARDVRLDRIVAVKLIHRHLRNSEEVARRFVLEATTIAKLKHPNVVEVYDVSDADATERFLVVEYVEGFTLRALTNQRGALVPELAVAIALEVGKGLVHAHEHGVIHRDVKPENVLLQVPSNPTSGDGLVRPRVKLTDFGIAKLLDSQGVTSTGQVLGSPSHMAPEQIEGGQVDERADVFALGVLLYEALVGKLPFAGEHPAQVLRKVLAGQFISVERAQPKVGAAYSRIVDKALARSLEDRFSSVSEMMTALREELAALEFLEPESLLELIATPSSSIDEQIVEKLIARGERARVGGNVVGAADCLGRALAYRPGDKVLIGRLSGLARRRIFFKGLWATGLALVTVLVIGWLVRRMDKPELPNSPKAKASEEFPNARSPVTLAAPTAERDGGISTNSRLKSPGVERNEPLLVPSTSSPRSPKEPRRPAKVSVRSRTPRTASKGAALDPAAGNRDVVVRITGAMGGTLKIDGEAKPWFGDIRHSLPVGPHLFEFESPDTTCCDSRSRTVQVESGEGVQRVTGQIPFRSARLRIDSRERSAGTLQCPTLFSGKQPFPGEREVPMARLQARGVCTLRSEQPGALPQRRVIRLRAGRTTVIPWP